MSRRLAAALCGAAAACTVFNPLDHLQAGRDAPVGADASSSDAPVEPQDAGGGAEAEAATVLPGCPPEQWSTCGAVLLASNQLRPTGVTFTFGHIYWTNDDATSGAIMRAPCTTSSCDAPSVFIAGEVSPTLMAGGTGWLLWTTPTEVRRRKVVGADASAEPIETVDAVSNPRALAYGYPHTVWTDQTSTRGCGNACSSIVTILSVPVETSTVSSGRLFAVSEGRVVTCPFDQFTLACSPKPLRDTEGAQVIANEGPHSLAVSVAKDGVWALVVPPPAQQVTIFEPTDQTLRVAEEPTPIVAIVSAGNALYWTTATGELRRRQKAGGPVLTVLHGLGPRTALAAADDGSEAIFVADREGGRVLRVLPP